MVKDDFPYDPWLDVSASNLISDSNVPALDIETIGDISPLGSQLGIVSKKTVPDALRNILFGQPELTTCAVVDAAKIPNLPEVLENSDLEHRCLFKGRAYDDLKNVAPWIVRLVEGNAFTRSLFTKINDQQNLWDNEPAIFVCGKPSLDEMWHHFRKFIRIQDSTGRWLYFRFWESNIIPLYWKKFRNSRSRASNFFYLRASTRSIEVIFKNGNSWGRIKPASNLEPPSHEISTFSIDESDWAFFQVLADKNLKESARRRLEVKLGPGSFNSGSNIPNVVDHSFDFIRDRSGGETIDLESLFSLSLLTILWGNYARTIMEGPVLNEPLIPIKRRIRLAQQSYFETMNQLLERKV